MVFEIPPDVSEQLDRVLDKAYTGHQINFDVLCSRLNAKVFNAKFDDPDVSGIVRRETDESFSIYLNQKHAENRKRFTLAHELGHIISYNANSYSKEKLLQEGFIERKTLYKVTDPAETEANEIAANILMPANFLESYISKAKDMGVEQR